MYLLFLSHSSYLVRAFYSHQQQSIFKIFMCHALNRLFQDNFFVRRPALSLCFPCALSLLRAELLKDPDKSLVGDIQLWKKTEMGKDGLAWTSVKHYFSRFGLVNTGLEL